MFELQGEISRSTSALLEKCLDAAFEVDATAVIIDLTDVAVFAEAGVEVLAEMRERCASAGRPFDLRSENSTTAGILELFDWTGSPAPSSLAML